MKRFRIEVSGLVQGVGFRPFVYRLALTHRIRGFVRNSLQGVTIEAEGLPTDIADFMKDLGSKTPTAASIKALVLHSVPLSEDLSFHIEASLASGMPTARMPHDRAPCINCCKELKDPSNRRFRYPFITCEDCGPRFTITESLPFDRERTTMRHFQLCALCLAEFSDPFNPRFHTQTISCSICGPNLSFMLDSANELRGEGALNETVSILRQGGLIALKGIGGYQLVCSTLADQSIARIRRFKARRRKPFAVMARDETSTSYLCHTNALELATLRSASAPVVLLYVKDQNILRETVHQEIAPGLQTLGVMLPSSPLHHLLLDGARSWLLVTSANRRNEPMYTDDHEARLQLEGIVDGILCHNRPIAHLADDSVVRAAGERIIILRHARGFAPSEFVLASRSGSGAFHSIGMGGHTKAAFALRIDERLILGQHLGNLESPRSRVIFQQELRSFEKLYGFDAKIGLTCRDAHPAYGSSVLAEEQGHPIQTIYHHEAHLESLIAEKGSDEIALGVVCDGSGIGPDHSIWGGEFFLVADGKRERIGSLRPFCLPGGEKAIKEPKRSAYGLLYEVFAEASSCHPFVKKRFSIHEAKLLAAAVRKKINAPYTTSLGRLFDGLAALLGICLVSDYEAEAPMAFEALAHHAGPQDPFPIFWEQDYAGLWRWDWRNIVSLAFEARGRELSRRVFASAFHSTIVKAIFDLASHCKVKTIFLTGGVFQNAVLVELCQNGLSAAGLSVKTHQLIPPGDGGLALGQVAAACRRGTCALAFPARF